MERTYGLLFSGFTVKAGVILGALYTAHYVYTVFAAPMAAISHGLAAL
jgi:hypothetical protein